MRRKELLAAGFVRDILFRNGDDCQVYISELDHRKVNYKILDSAVRDDGGVIIRILQQYNNVPLIQLYDDDDAMNEFLQGSLELVK